MNNYVGPEDEYMENDIGYHPVLDRLYGEKETIEDLFE